MQFQRFGCVAVNEAQERQKLVIAMALVRAMQNRTVGNIEGSRQRGNAVADVVMCCPLNIFEFRCQYWLSALQQLELILLINAKTKAFSGGLRYNPSPPKVMNRSCLFSPDRHRKPRVVAMSRLETPSTAINIILRLYHLRMRGCTRVGK